MSASMGCKLFGACRTAISIKDAAVLIHSTAGCNWGTSVFHNPSRMKDVRQASSVLYEEDIIYGGGAALEKALDHMALFYDCSVVFVLTGCVAEIMEDDVEGILRGFPSQKPVLLVKAAGFKGDMASGVEDAMKILIDHMEVKKKRKNSINLVGIFSDDFKSDADIDSIKKLLGKDVDINTVIPYDSYTKILGAPEAALNVVLKGFEHAGEQMKQKFGIPYIAVNFPYGIEGSRDFAMTVAENLKLKADDCMEAMEKKAVEKLEMAYGYIHKLYGMPVAVKGDCARAPALRGFLENELGMNVEVLDTGCSGNDRNGFEGLVEDSNSVIVFASSYERGLAERLDIPLIRYTYPVFDSISVGNRSYAGFEGTVNLVEDMVNAVMTANYRRDGMYG